MFVAARLVPVIPVTIFTTRMPNITARARHKHTLDFFMTTFLLITLHRIIVGRSIMAVGPSLLSTTISHEMHYLDNTNYSTHNEPTVI